MTVTYHSLLPPPVVRPKKADNRTRWCSRDTCAIPRKEAMDFTYHGIGQKGLRFKQQRWTHQQCMS